MCFGGGSDSSDKMLQMQEEEAADARAKAEEHTRRLNDALSRIRGIFEPHAETAAKTFDWSKFNPKTAKVGAVPGMAGYNVVNLPAVAGSPAVAARGATRGPGIAQAASEGGTHYIPGAMTPAVAAQAAVEGRPAGMYIKGPDGKIYKQGDTITGQVPTGRMAGGYGDDFFGRFKDSITDYYMPEVQRQYGDAQEELTYRLADAGQMTSSTAIDKQADLSRQNYERRTDVKNQAETAAGKEALRIADMEQTAINQAMAAENPDVGVTTATNSIRNISPEATDLTPLGAIFDIASVGAAKFGAGYQNAKDLARIRNIQPVGAKPGGYIA